MTRIFVLSAIIIILSGMTTIVVMDIVGSNKSVKTKSTPGRSVSANTLARKRPEILYEFRVPLFKGFNLTLRYRKVHRFYLTILFGIFCSFLLLFLTKKMISPRLVEFLIAFSVLLLFEFITDLMEEPIKSYTRRMPVTEFLMITGLAAIMESMHHKLAAWLQVCCGVANVKNN
ncbi:hypothetical protein [Mucilaginibacter jinjuensis]|uniref:Uncharacterized protein n=1 Tax=Mucilaginibacter jinjuensis TaxID=1176721 RepID=A0ABY7TD14_9SPHI|nr:hypothetical protein [Mucilaginibacter jinjuensis]WCT14414.1 hypothetical protein PQO05_10770 [Mucilaginibacter jinjuensis]